MRPTMDFRHRHNEYFHPHPLHGTFALIASMALGGLILMVILVELAR